MAKKWDEVKSSKQAVVDAIKVMTTEAGSDATAKTAVKAASDKLANAKDKWPPDPGTLAAIKTLYEKAQVAISSIVHAAKVQVSLTSTTKPKFMHNAGKAGVIPKWTFGYTDTVSKKTGSVVIEMTSAMGKDEPTAKKLMAEAALTKVKAVFPKAESVTMVSSTMSVGD